MMRVRTRLGLRVSTVDQEKKEKNKDELFVQKIKNSFFIKHNCL